MSSGFPEDVTRRIASATSVFRKCKKRPHAVRARQFVCSDPGVAAQLIRVPLGLVVILLSLALPTIARADETVMVCDIYGNHVAARPAAVPGIRTSERCPGNAAPASYTRSRPPGGMAIWTVAGTTVKGGQQVGWRLRPPAGLVISSVYIPHMYSRGINDKSGWRGGLFWKGGSGGARTFNGESGWSSANSGGPSFNWPSGGTRSFGWRLGCRERRCRNGGNRWLTVELAELRVRETQRPRLTAPDGLWKATGWIRGWWALHFSGHSPTGLCALSAIVDGKTGPGSASERRPALWHQCAAPPVDQAIDTAQYGQGAMPLTITAVDAAGQSVSYTRMMQVDNQQPTVSLSGPRQASSAAGVQYVRATAAAGPSGVAGIVCSVDGAPNHWYPAASASIPVRGTGVHHVACYSQSNARDAAGKLATSAAQTWTMRIRSPSVSTLSLVRIAGALHCVHRRERVRIPGHWSTAYRHRHRVRVWVPAQTRRVRVVHCRPRVVHRRVRRHGHWIRKRIVLLPHRVDVKRLRVRFGDGARLTGWLGTPSGDALAGQRVRIMSSPANGSGNYRQVAVARTGPDGVWKAHLRPGPSRILVAAYKGSGKAEPSTSRPVHLVVPASLRLRIEPRRVHWGGTIRISGAVRGGYIPAEGEIVFLWAGWRGGKAEIGHLYTRTDGAFSTAYTFHAGTGRVKYSIWATTVRESDYPYVPNHSKHVSVTVSP
jgi:hypothetical protein